MILEVELQERLFDTDFISLWEDVVFRQGSTDCLSSQACGFAVIGLRCLKLPRSVVYLVLFLPVSRLASASFPLVATWLRSWQFILLDFNRNRTCAFSLWEGVVILKGNYCYLLLVAHWPF